MRACLGHGRLGAEDALAVEVEGRLDELLDALGLNGGQIHVEELHAARGGEGRARRQAGRREGGPNPAPTAATHLHDGALRARGFRSGGGSGGRLLRCVLLLLLGRLGLWEGRGGRQLG